MQPPILRLVVAIWKGKVIYFLSNILPIISPKLPCGVFLCLGRLLFPELISAPLCGCVFVCAYYASATDLSFPFFMAYSIKVGGILEEGK